MSSSFFPLRGARIVGLLVGLILGVGLLASCSSTSSPPDRLGYVDESQTTSDSAYFGPMQAPFSDSAALAQCDAANGELLEVIITATADGGANYILQSRSDVAQDATVEAELTVALDGPGLVSPLVVDINILETVAVGAGALIEDSALAASEESVSITDPAALATFTGTGTLTYTIDADGIVSSSFSNGNGFGGGTNEVSGAVLTLSCVFEAPADPSVAIEKSTNGVDADAVPGASLVVNDLVTWTYDVTNDGDVDLTDVVVTDDVIGDICTIASLPVGESDSCSSQGVAAEGSYANVGTVSADSESGQVTDSDPSNYTAGPGVGTGTIGYWKSHASCANNSGRQDGVLDENLPVRLWSGFSAVTCDDAVSLLDKSPVDSKQKKAKDPVINMTAQYVGAMLNMNNGAHRCAELFDLLAAAEAILADVGFDGTEKYDASDAALTEANRLAELLDEYNNGGFCPNNESRG